MKNSPLFFALLFCSLILSNCAGRKEFVSLSPSLQKEITSTRVYIEKGEEHIEPEIETSNISTYTGGGLLFALADCAIMSHREECANEALTEVQKVMGTFDFKGKFRDKLGSLLQDTSWIQVQKINDLEKENDKLWDETVEKTSTDCILTSKLLYKLNPQFNVLTGTLYIALYPTSRKMKGLVKAENPLEAPLFKFHISKAERLPYSTQDIQGNAKVWAQDRGAYLRKALQNTLDQIFISLGNVLKNPALLPDF